MFFCKNIINLLCTVFNNEKQGKMFIWQIFFMQGKYYANSVAFFSFIK